ncbi:lipid A-modifier LpxR family protein [Nioella nitratireducens]|uniref:lipid A-modifier LpxR family protein n=1 Tax=Nioella nitratireducens TaxID=1287720 RepID=UPI0008FD04E9|nr:lipid A-modifier LpxR family protein [Nioella nitratireducens]
MKQALGPIGLFLCVLAFGAPGAAAQGVRPELGQARLFTNDLIGDGHDRWRTGAYWVSSVRGAGWDGVLPTRMGDVMEYRFRGEVLSPANLNRPAAGDRLYAGVLSVGAHSHFQWSGFEMAVGADIVAMGEQTGVRRLQAGVHDLLSLQSSNVSNFQVDNGIFLHGTVEIGREMNVGPARVRPFVELQAGVETMARVGMDVTFGNYGEGGLRLRDVTTGQRISAIDSESDFGLSWVLGGDVAYVDSSHYLPSDRGYVLEDTRYRLRAGMNYAFGYSNVFYGLTYLSEEFVGQSSGQTVGSLTVALEF